MATDEYVIASTSHSSQSVLSIGTSDWTWPTTTTEWTADWPTTWSSFRQFHGDRGCLTGREACRRERLREMIRSRMAPAVITRRGLSPPRDIRETRARETLRAVLGEDKFRQFIKNGFVTIRAKSGLVYQIFTGDEMTNVYDHGKRVERLCVVLKGGFPPTDSLLMRYLLILNDEREFRKPAIRHSFSQRDPPVVPAGDGDLVRIYREMTGRAA